MKVGLGTSFEAPVPNENTPGGFGGDVAPKLNTAFCVVEGLLDPKLEACDWGAPKLLFVPNAFELGAPKGF